MISRAHKWIYIHPAKTGGTSIETALAPYSDNELRVGGLPLGNPQVIDGRADIKHARLDYFKSKLGTAIRDYFIFVTIRNPWDRCVSAWLWFNRIMPPIPFAEWLRLLSRREMPRRELRHLIDPCVDFVRTNPPLDIRYIRFEYLRDDFEDLCADLDLPALDLPHELKTEREHYSTYYDNDNQRERVARFFARDIRRFRYAFERVA